MTKMLKWNYFNGRPISRVSPEFTADFYDEKVVLLDGKTRLIFTTKKVHLTQKMLKWNYFKRALTNSL